MAIMAPYTFQCLGIAQGLHTKLKPILRITVKLHTTNTTVAFLDGVDVEDTDTGT